MIVVGFLLLPSLVHYNYSRGQTLFKGDSIKVTLLTCNIKRQYPLIISPEDGINIFSYLERGQYFKLILQSMYVTKNKFNFHTL